jgi:hypothetical protein
MKPVLALIAAAFATLPVAAAAQELDVTRRQYTFLNSRLDVAVLAEAPGVLHLVRGQEGRLEVAARSRDGFAGFGLGGNATRELRLSAVGSESVQYMVVVPERVIVYVRLPDGQRRSLGPGQRSGTYTWSTAPVTTAMPPVMPAVPEVDLAAGGVYVAHRAVWAPEVINVPELAAIRTLSIRFEGSEFRVGASRPLVVQPGSRSHMDVRVDGDPLDLVIYVPRGRAPFALRSGGVTLATLSADRAETQCRNVVIHNPVAEQTWFTFYPQAGRLDCR